MTYDNGNCSQKLVVSVLCMLYVIGCILVTQYLCATAGENELYIAGGDHFGATECSMFKWSPEDNHFEDMSAMQVARKQ